MRIVVRDLSVTLGGHKALDGVSASMPDGEVTAVIGPSGAGKSTLAGVVAGLVAADEGTVHFDDEDTAHLPAERRRLGVVFQDLRLFPFLTGWDNVAFGPRVAGEGATEIARRVSEALERTRAGGFAKRAVSTMSGGEKQRIALARALATAPRGLLLDEPFSSLDADLRAELRVELAELVTKLKLTTVIITHDREDAFAMANRVIVLRDGRIEQAGTVADCYGTPVTEFAARLLGDASFLDVDERDGDRARVSGAWISVIGDGQRVVVRSEDVSRATGDAPWRGTVIDTRFSSGRHRVVVDLDGGGRIIALLDEPAALGPIALAPRRPLPLV
jgi:ABC-type sulfate/molybdate transport systems ATPase subunit